MTVGILIHEGTTLSDEKSQLNRQSEAENSMRVGYELSSGMKGLKITIGKKVTKSDINSVLTPVELLTTNLSLISCGVPRVAPVSLVYRHEDKLIRVGRTEEDRKRDEDAHQRRQAEFERKKIENEEKSRKLTIKQEQETSRIARQESAKLAKIARNNDMATKSAIKTEKSENQSAAKTSKKEVSSQPGIMSMFKTGAKKKPSQEVEGMHLIYSSPVMVGIL